MGQQQTRDGMSVSFLRIGSFEQFISKNRFRKPFQHSNTWSLFTLKCSNKTTGVAFNYIFKLRFIFMRYNNVMLLRQRFSKITLYNLHLHFKRLNFICISRMKSLDVLIQYYYLKPRLFRWPMLIKRSPIKLYTCF